VSEPVDKRRLAELRSLLSTIEEAGWEYARVEIDGVTLTVSSNPEFTDAPAPTASTAAAPSATLPAPAPSAPAPAAEAPATADPGVVAPASSYDGPVETVTSPTIGLFWRSPKPGAPPFVEVGGVVSEGETLCIIEVMKLMTHVVAPVGGTVRAIHIENGSMVEHGTVLMDVAPTGAEGAAS
jgi:acetyl-CoA carboxylase biotin carboxyl carrier protein